MSPSKKLVHFSYPHSSNIINDYTLSPSNKQPPTPEPHTVALPTTSIPTRPHYLDAVRPVYSGAWSKDHYDPDWEYKYFKPPTGLGLHIPTISVFLIHTFFNNPDYAHRLIDYFNKSARVQPPLTITRPIVRHRHHFSHFEPRRSDPYCTCSCCHYDCPTHSL